MGSERLFRVVTALAGALIAAGALLDLWQRGVEALDTATLRVVAGVAVSVVGLPRPSPSWRTSVGVAATALLAVLYGYLAWRAAEPVAYFVTLSFLPLIGRVLGGDRPAVVLAAAAFVLVLGVAAALVRHEVVTYEAVRWSMTLALTTSLALFDVAATQELRAREEQAQRSRRRGERLALLGRLLASVAHEVRGPLGVAVGNVDLLRREEPLDSARRPLLDDAAAGLARATDIVQRLTGFSRDPPTGPTETTLADAVSEAVRFARPRLVGVELRVDVPPGLRARIHPGECVQVLLNLLLNATDAVAGRAVRDVEVRGRGTPEGMVELRVRDSGPGVPRRELEAIFEPFYTTKDEGLGLGLALCREYAERAGGTLHAERNPAGGSVFVLRLPQAG